MSQVLEGTWEEILQGAQQLAGKRVRVVVLDDLVGVTVSLDEQERLLDELAA